jgi:hypothetical protein
MRYLALVFLLVLVAVALAAGFRVLDCDAVPALEAGVRELPLRALLAGEADAG